MKVVVVKSPKLLAPVLRMIFKIKKENVKNEIVDYRRKINIEKDNMAKILVNMKLLQDEIKEN